MLNLFQEMAQEVPEEEWIHCHGGPSGFAYVQLEFRSLQCISHWNWSYKVTSEITSKNIYWRSSFQEKLPFHKKSTEKK